MSGPRGAGGDETPSAPSTGFNEPNGNEKVEIYNLLSPADLDGNPKARATPDEILEWLKAHKNVRADWTWEGEGRLEGILTKREAEGTYPDGPPEDIAVVKANQAKILDGFFKSKNIGTTFLGYVFLSPANVAPDHPLVKEVLARNPNLTRVYSNGRTLREELVPMTRSRYPETKTRATDKLALLDAEIARQRKGVANLMKLEDLGRGKAENPKRVLLHPVAQASIAPFLVGGPEPANPLEQINKMRASIQRNGKPLEPLNPPKEEEKKGGRRTRRRNQKRKTRRRH